MTRPVLVLRPQPGADATAARAQALGMEAIVAPLFRIGARDWSPPEQPCEALLITSANAVATIGDRVARALPVYAVGKATADAATRAGFPHVTAGDAGVAEIVAQAAAAGVRSLLHLAGADRTDFTTQALRIETRTVYSAEEAEPSAAFGSALARDAIALLHSARAARRFRDLAGPDRAVAALSPAVLAAAGPWRAAAVAERPTDDALLAAATRLCQG